MAKYSRAGVKIYYACATRGEAGSVSAEQLRNPFELGDLRWAELECAAQILGLAGIIYLGYRDSGMTGSDNNKKAGALSSVSIQEVTGSIVRVIRKVQPQVVITFDPIGGYRHPDHIAVHDATVRAFYAAGDLDQYPEEGPVFHPQKLYFSVFPRGLLKLFVKIMPLLGQDPHRFGRNKDIDLASILEVDYPMHARVSLSKLDISVRMKAVSCHASQLEDNSPRRSFLILPESFSGRKTVLCALILRLSVCCVKQICLRGSNNLPIISTMLRNYLYNYYELNLK